MIFAIDFDGTCCTNAFPQVGYDIGAAPVIKQLLANGHSCFIWTCRSNRCGTFTNESTNDTTINGVKQWLHDHNLNLPINNNGIDNSWTDSQKLFAHFYIDDLALNAPLTAAKDQFFIDWYKVCDLLESYNILSTQQVYNLKTEIFHELSKTMQVLVPRPIH